MQLSCKHSSRQQKHYAEFISIAQSRGGKLLSDRYENTDTHLLFKCSCGYQWYGTPDHIKRGSWCPKCGGSDSQTGEEKFRQVVASKGGKVLGQYKNSKTKILIECNMGHQIDVKTDDITREHSWCRTCSGRDSILPAQRIF